MLWNNYYPVIVNLNEQHIKNPSNSVIVLEIENYTPSINL